MADSSPLSWTSLKDEDLLKLKISDLGLKIEGSELEDRVKTFYSELEGKGIDFKPKLYLGDEWFSPEGMLAIAIPFYLAHPRLMALEKTMMLEVEGGTPDWCQKLLRHEAGHCFDHAYRFSKKRSWRDTFGSPDQEYAPETYRPKPYSKSFVNHLGNWYSQAHPDEDFAETFAVWLTPDLDWKKEYRKWPGALEKLQYIEKIAEKVRGKNNYKEEKGSLPYNATRMKTTLGKYYAKRKKEHETDYPDFYDQDLRRIFNGDSGLAKRDFGAAQYMRKNSRVIIDSVSYWSGEKKYPIQNLVKKFAHRSEELNLKLGRTQADTSLQISAYLATLVSHYLFTGKFKRSV